MVDLSLPPGVSGAPRGHITLTIDEIIWSSDAQPVPCGVKVSFIKKYYFLEIDTLI